MQIELCVKWFDSDWSGQIVFVLLFSNKGRSLSLSKCVTNTQAGLQSGIGAEGLSTGAFRQKRWPGRAQGRKGVCLVGGGVKDCAGICQKPIIIWCRRGVLYQTVKSISHYFEYGSIYKTHQIDYFWCYNGSFICGGPRQQLLFNYWACLWVEKKKKIQQDRWIFICLK